MNEGLKDTFKDSFDIIEEELKEGEKSKRLIESIKAHAQLQVANINGCAIQKCILVLVMEKDEEYELVKEVLL